MRALLFGMLVACGEPTSSEGRFAVAWQPTENGLVIDCEAAGIETILIVTDDGAQLVTEQFLCVDLEAITGPRAPGTYTIDVDALDAAEVVVATSSDQGLAIAGQTTDLGVFPLEIADEVCDASTCPTGCCDDTGACVDPQTDLACGIGGIGCVDCSALGQGCNSTEGLCVE